MGGKRLINIVWLVFTLGCITSCQRDEPVADEEVTISFRLMLNNEGWGDNQREDDGHILSDRYSRGMLRSVMYDSFACWAGFYEADEPWSNHSQMNLMYHREIKKAELYDTHAYWPGVGKKVRFFAYAPYAWSALVLPEHVAGNPRLVYTVPMEIAAQKDLLIAWTGEYSGSYGQSVDLKFRHALTAIRFIDCGLPEGVVTSITLEGVYSKACLTIGDDLSEIWSGREAKCDFTVWLNYRTSSTSEPETVINPLGECFLMIPQVMENSARLILRMRSDDGKEMEYATPLKGTADWEMGKVTSYRLRINNGVLVVVESLADWQDGGSL